MDSNTRNCAAEGLHPFTKTEWRRVSLAIDAAQDLMEEVLLSRHDVPRIVIAALLERAGEELKTAMRFLGHKDGHLEEELL